MTPSLLHTLLELGHSTSQNLGFAYADPATSYGEETITETNLIEIRRRHPHSVKVYTFSKQKESHVTGADWEWHIIGRALTLKLRVQAKRVTKNGAIRKLDSQAKKAPLPQIDLLIKNASTNHLKPVYCFYCAEQHRDYWTAEVTGDEYTAYETGCLIADALVVRAKSPLPKRFSEIEADTVPWHYLFAGGSYRFSVAPYELRFQEPPTYRLMQEIRRPEYLSIADLPERATTTRMPTVVDLNTPDRRDFDREGVHETDLGAFEREIQTEEFEKRGISRLVLIDARELDFMTRMFQTQI